MKNSIGNNLQVTLFGESHGPYIGAVLDGLASGIRIDEAFIAHQLDLRRPSGTISTARVEADNFQIVSGAFNGYTTGTSLCILIPNSSQKSKDYTKMATVARPGHADYTANCRYNGFQDYRGGGHFSGRITAALVAAAGIVIPALKNKGIEVATHIKSCAGFEDTSFSLENAILRTQIADLNDSHFALINQDIKDPMVSAMEAVAAEGDSVGGVLETAVAGLPAGIGEPWFDTVEGLLSHALFSIPAIKGVEFGAGFDLVGAKGSVFNDPFRMVDGKVVTITNNNGGINGGITNGMPVMFRCAVKPTPSIYKTQETVDFGANANTTLNIEGRHDPAIIHRARVVVDSVTALVLYDILSGYYGTQWFGG